MIEYCFFLLFFVDVDIFFTCKWTNAIDATRSAKWMWPYHNKKAYRLPWCAWINRFHFMLARSFVAKLSFNWNQCSTYATYAMHLLLCLFSFCVLKLWAVLHSHKHVIIRWAFYLANGMYVHKFLILRLFSMQLHFYTRIAIALVNIHLFLFRLSILLLFAVSFQLKIHKFSRWLQHTAANEKITYATCISK